MKTGTVAKWLKKEGDELKAGDSIAEIETDKASVTFDTTDDGYLAKILVQEGTSDVAVGTAIAITVESQSEVAAFKDYQAPAAVGAAPAAAAAPPPPPIPAAAAPAAAPIAAKPAPAAAAAPAVAPRPQPAAVTATASPAAPAPAGSAYLAFEGWGASLARSPLGVSLATQQNTYAALFGYTGFDPLPSPVADKKPAKAAAK